MSGVFGWVDLRGAAPDSTDIQRVARAASHRGRDHSYLWAAGPVVLGTSVLATGRAGSMPALVHHAGVVAVGDVRIANRGELAARLAVDEAVGDVELLVRARGRWGDRLLDHLVGDFVAALWFPEDRRVELIRDHLGARRVVHHLRPGGVFAFATDASTVLAMPGVSVEIDEARVTDFFTDDLEGIDHTCTMYRDVFRLPPAHLLTMRHGIVSTRRIWDVPVREPSHRVHDDDHVAAFVEVFRRAVEDRVDGPDTASMLSGGLDSGTVSWMAADVLRDRGLPPLHTVSAVADGDEVETRLARASARAIGSVPHEVDVASFVAGGGPERILDLAEEPFDVLSTLVWAMYLRAGSDGFTVLLDGAGADVVLSEGNRTGRLVLGGHPRQAYRGLAADDEHWGERRSPLRLVRAMVGSSLPAPLRRAVQRRELRGPVAISEWLSPDVSARVDLAGRARRSAEAFLALPVRAAGAQRARMVTGSMLTVGIERYERIAGRCGVESRGPFLDRQVVELVNGLPDRVLHDRGWHKALLRRAGAGHLPPEVRWKRGRDHLGDRFMLAVSEVARERFLDDRAARFELLRPLLSDPMLAALRRVETVDLDSDDASPVVCSLVLADWMRRDVATRARNAKMV